MYDDLMQDFPQDSTMDADMLPSAVSDTDWFPVENMMEDGEPQKPPSQEVDMSNDDVQEFEMRDADAEYAGTLGQVTEDSTQLFRSELQDQDIPDASRAPSPLALATIPLPIPPLADPVESEAASDQALQQDTVNQSESETTQDTQSSKNNESKEAEVEPVTRPTIVADQQIPLGDVRNMSAADIQDNSTISGESTRSPQLEPQEEKQQQGLDALGHIDAPETSTHGQEPYEGDPTEYNADTEGHDVVGEPVTEHQVADAEDDGLLMDPPSPVLLFYPFDNSRFFLFGLPELSPTSEVPADSHDESTTSPDAEAEHEPNYKPETSNNHQAFSDAEPAASSDQVLLFQDRVGLYYEPLSFIFEALRMDNNFNVGGRFDENIELVVSAPELDLTLPEDNIYSREVSLHDLNVLHNGCELSGPLSLRLDTVSPRFGTRYKAIRDEIVRVVSQQEEHERQSQVDAGDEYLAGSPLHDSSENEPQGGASSYPQELERENLEASGDNGKRYLEPSEPQPNEGRDTSREDKEPDSGQGEDPKETDASEGFTSEEYFVSHEYDPGEPEEQDSEEHYVGQEEDEGLDADYDGEDAHYDDINDPEQQYEDIQNSREDQQDVPDDDINALETPKGAPGIAALDDSVDAFDDDLLATRESPRNSNLPLEHVALVDSSDVAWSKSPVVSKPRIELQASSSEVVSHQSDADAKVPSDADSLLTEERSRSRSRTPRPSVNDNHEPVSEDSVTDEKQPQAFLMTNNNRTSSRAASTTSKRSHDELEDQTAWGDTPNASTESKRLRID